MTVYTPDSSAWITDIPIIIDGDKRKASVIQPMYQKSADRFAYLNRVYPKESINNQTGNPLTPTYNSSTPWAIEPNSYIDIPNCAVGDQIVGKVNATITSTNGTTLSYFIVGIDDVSGTPHSGRFSGCQNMSHGVYYSNNGFYIKLFGVWTVAHAGTTRVGFGVAESFSPGTHLDVYEVTVKTVLFSKL